MYYIYCDYYILCYIFITSSFLKKKKTKKKHTLHPVLYCVLEIFLQQCRHILISDYIYLAVLHVTASVFIHHPLLRNNWVVSNLFYHRWCHNKLPYASVILCFCQWILINSRGRIAGSKSKCICNFVRY